MTHETIGMGGQILLAVVKTLILIVGGLVTYFAYKAYRRTDERSLGLLAVGFGCITLGVLMAGLVYEVLGMMFGIEVGLGWGVIVESSLVLTGMVVIAYSLYDR